MEEGLFARQPAGLKGVVAGHRWGIAGCGGLGSHIADMLVRSGAEDLVLVDDDQVELSNLNRQIYTRRDLGQPKTAALARHLYTISPSLRLTSYPQRITRQNARTLFAGVTLLFEALDTPEGKALIFQTFQGGEEGLQLLVGASGMGGIGAPGQGDGIGGLGTVPVQRAGAATFICGDGVSGVESQGVAAPRVLMTAAAQVNTAFAFIMDRGRLTKK